jgi:hypothetical protein
MPDDASELLEIAFLIVLVVLCMILAMIAFSVAGGSMP